MAVRTDCGSISLGAEGAWLDWSAAQAAKTAGAKCGDGYLFRIVDGKLLVALADGTGSGAEAHETANACLHVLSVAQAAPLPELFEAAGQSLRGTRGAALALALIDPSDGTVDWAALGDVDGVIRPLPPCQDQSTGILQTGGMLGMKVSRIYTQRQAFPPGHLIVLASDGISRRFREMPPPAQMPLQEYVAACMEAYGKPHDDRTVLAIAHRQRRQ
ncbi:serine/threonine-protein phosphatase [Leisingera aquaemixtae]|uniref:SpoIIE family protein phosphatase n=1 Tax=Leisingera aquaemixtae TaxID=1396826 RepID=UPI001C974583|nr:SpoIIE family protein phosphatase [Leisingera aquaemixtae]MBY6067206.1 serine/threonine-protein phosphatase [Leisingera aquaemixtae]